MLHNAGSFAAFLFSPLQMALLSRALGADGFGRWWWTFVCLEMAALIGMQSADLYVRRELPGQANANDRSDVHRLIGTAIAVAGGASFAVCFVQVMCAPGLARIQGDPLLSLYVATLALQPVLTNLTGVLAAALQSIDIYRQVAMIRSVLGPAMQCVFLAVAWQSELPPRDILIGLVAVSGLTLVAMTLLYRRHFDLRLTLAGVTAPREVLAFVSFGLSLLPTNLLWTLGGKVDLYLLRAYVSPAALGVYAACLQLVSALPNIRSVFDPIAQAQVASLQRSGDRLGSSLRHLSRLCTITLLPVFVGLVSLGEPVLGILLGRPAPGTSLPLTILSVGQLLGSIALASWLAPMLLPGRALNLLAGMTLLLKSLSLLALAPRFGATGAALATAFATVMAQHGMAWLASRALGVRVWSRKLLLANLCVMALGGLAALLLILFSDDGDVLFTLALGCAVTGILSVSGLALLLDSGERRALRSFFTATRAATE